ncbi:hypothetical protein E4P41_08020 [Geodermatophilus sp. DF01-2]|uniref:hypothetical protein n=1 Tax=Geodermatophilus sp. DF01-2 TaxID=2559610 RepID=UPI0010734861|nr:hypothetical protein [Geodermatophilus sp. DF01_2]TFV62185.1 hypothetical protein E4P41_08020 [Geodermatophilus sp. DF01_2]
MRRTALVAVALLCAACSGAEGGAVPRSAAGTTSATPALPAVPGIAAEVVRLRTDAVVDGQVHVRVTGTGEEPFTVTGVAIDSPGFAPLPPSALTAAFEPGRAIDLRTSYGEPVCAAEVGPVAAWLTLIRPDGTVEEVRVPLAGDDLDAVHREECAVASLRAAAEVGLTGLAATAESVTGTVVLTRVGDDDRAVTVVDARRSIVLDVAVDGLPMELEPGEERTAAEVEFTAASCEPHVLAETKQPFVFPLAVAVGNAEPVPLPLPVDAAQEVLLWGLLDRMC